MQLLASTIITVHNSTAVVNINNNVVVVHRQALYRMYNMRLECTHCYCSCSSIIILIMILNINFLFLRILLSLLHALQQVTSGKLVLGAVVAIIIDNTTVPCIECSAFSFLVDE